MAPHLPMGFERSRKAVQKRPEHPARLKERVASCYPFLKSSIDKGLTSSKAEG
jgi:hypothetical protein